MKCSLQQVMCQAVAAYNSTSRCEWVTAWPGQIVLAASIVHWTVEVIQSMAMTGGMDLYHSKCNSQIDDTVKMVRGQLPSMARITLEALIVIDVHGELKSNFQYVILNTHVQFIQLVFVGFYLSAD